MATFIKGKDLMIFKKTGTVYKAMAWATSHTMSISRDMIDIASKDHGQWGASESGKINWTLTSEHLMSELDYETLMTEFIAGDTFTVAFVTAANATTGEVPTGGWTIGTGGFEGTVILSTLDATATNGEVATFSATFTGVGEWKKRA